jgi:RNA polymerase sigma factor (sigma-70 family)
MAHAPYSGKFSPFLKDSWVAEDVVPLNEIDRHVGAQMRARRLFLQMPEEWLAGMLRMTVAELATIEAGRARIEFETMMSAAEYLGVPERYFYMGFRGGPPDGGKRTWLKEADVWFSQHLFPYESALLAVARRMTGNRETARDMVQETYADMLAGERWRTVQNPRAYAMRALRNYALTFLQRARVVPIELIANMETLPHVDDAPNAHDLLSAKEKRDLLLKAIEALPPKCRQVVKLRRLREMPQKEIAKHLGISESSVEKHLARGMQLIAESLQAFELRAGDATEVPANDRASRQ